MQHHPSVRRHGGLPRLDLPVDIAGHPQYHIQAQRLDCNRPPVALQQLVGRQQPARHQAPPHFAGPLQHRSQAQQPGRSQQAFRSQRPVQPVRHQQLPPPGQLPFRLDPARSIPVSHPNLDQQQQSQVLSRHGQSGSLQRARVFPVRGGWRSLPQEIQENIFGRLLLQDGRLVPYLMSDGSIRICLEEASTNLDVRIFEKLSRVSRLFRNMAFYVFSDLTYRQKYVGSLWLECLPTFALEFLNNIELEFDLRTGADGIRVRSAVRMIRNLGHSRFLKRLALIVDTSHLSTEKRTFFRDMPVIQRLSHISNVETLIISFAPAWPQAEQWLRRQMTATQPRGLNNGNFMPANITNLPAVTNSYCWSNNDYEAWATALGIDRQVSRISNDELIKRIKEYQKGKKNQDIIRRD
jgi:hypothetical protein